MDAIKVINVDDKNRRLYREYMLVVIVTVGGFLVLMGMFIGKYPWTHNSYNSYTLQALSWLDGRLDLGRDYSHLELAMFNGKYYVSFPPFPSYIMLPFAFLFGENTPDYLIMYLFDFLSVIYMFKIAQYYKLSPEKSAICVLFGFLSTNVVFTMLNPYVWFIAQTMCFAFSVMSIYYVLNRKLSLGLLWWACSVGCRPMQVVYFVPLIILYVYVNVENENKDILQMVIMNLKKWYEFIPTLLIAISYMLLNYCRFGNITQFGHDYLPEFTEAEYGQFSSVYIKPNIESLFRWFRFDESGRMLIDRFNNISMIIVSPIFVFCIFVCVYRLVVGIYNKKINVERLFLIVNILIFSAVYMLMVLMHKTMGGWHFGNRYSNDILPYTYLIMIMCTSETQKLIKWEIPLGVFGMVINVVGTVIVYNGLS